VHAEYNGAKQGDLLQSGAGRPLELVLFRACRFQFDSRIKGLMISWL
jgi:hypothetical protein